MVSNLVFRWPKPLFFMVLGAHGIYIIMVCTWTFQFGCQMIPLRRVSIRTIPIGCFFNGTPNWKGAGCC